MSLEINKRIRYYREQKKISQEKLGEAIGMKCNAFSRMEREGNITVEDAIALANAMDIDPDLIIYGEERKKKELDFTPIETPVLIAHDPFKNNFLNSEGPKLYAIYTCDGFEITDEEKNIVKIFRNMPEDKKQFIREYFAENY